MNVTIQSTKNQDGDAVAKMEMQNVNIKPRTDDKTLAPELKDEDYVNAFVDETKDDEPFLKNQDTINEPMYNNGSRVESVEGGVHGWGYGYGYNDVRE